VLYVEATMMKGSKQFMITGSIGAIMQESAQAALSYIRSKQSNSILTQISTIQQISIFMSRPVLNLKMDHPQV